MLKYIRLGLSAFAYLLAATVLIFADASGLAGFILGGFAAFIWFSTAEF